MYIMVRKAGKSQKLFGFGRKAGRGIHSKPAGAHNFLQRGESCWINHR